MKAEEARGISIDASGVLSQANDVDLIERRRAQIVEAAVSLFARQGFYRTTVQEIARKANVSAGLIYHYARTKEDVLLLTLLHVLDTYRAVVPKALEGVTDPLERVRTVLSAFCHVVADNLDATVLVYRSTRSLPPAQRDMIKRSEIETNEILAEAIRACIRVKLFREVDVDFATYQLVMNIHMWALKHWHFKNRFDVDGFVAVSFDFFVNALATPKGLKAYERLRAARAAKPAPETKAAKAAPRRKSALR
jgi:AcrR family transcriptional regulator